MHLIVSINPLTLKYEELEEIDEKEVKASLKKYETHFHKLIFIVVYMPAFSGINMSRIQESSIESPDLKGKLFHYALEIIDKNKENILFEFSKNSPAPEGFTDTELEIFKRLDTNYDKLLMVKTDFNGLSTTAICDTTDTTEEGQTIIKPLVIIVTPEMFPMLTPPDIVKPLEEKS